MALLLQILVTFSILSLVAVGGANAVLPEMHRQLVELRGWMDDATFSQLYALAQAAPGPNILVASVMGWRVAAWGGMAMATLGMLLPSAILAWCMAGLLHRLRGAAWLKPAQAGLVPIAVGLLLAAGLVMAEASSQFGLLPLVIVAASTLFVWRTSWSPLWVLAGGGVLGLLLLG
ncbi:chromate transporter [Roseicella sp. DB1501]|jgi:chromate transporter|uniref:chromate transporter n=1 Tax=Roseicella sp. DB1501 TaxID=2730925 RepID=UPI0014912A55|nr:chromate transporter [Roseicella sp. DB1501]NOG70676.1 chromate transporter [Roseicella sp. DB1501]